MWIPKIYCWKLWLERNNRIFRDKVVSPAQVATKVKVLIGELVASNPKITNEASPDKKEYSWFHGLDPDLLTRTKNAVNHFSPWEIRLEEREFIKWRSSLNKHILHVDGASKGNPRPAGSGGVIIDMSGNIILKFAWGLGQNSNNIAEIIAIWQGLMQARSLSINKLAIIGDSRIIMQALNLRKRSIAWDWPTITGNSYLSGKPSKRLSATTSFVISIKLQIMKPILEPR